MAKVTLSVSMEESRLEALTYFMGKERRTPQKELEQTLQKLYEECVPPDTREYIERKAPTPPSRPRRPVPTRPSPAPVHTEGDNDGCGSGG